MWVVPKNLQVSMNLTSEATTTEVYAQNILVRSCFVATRVWDLKKKRAPWVHYLFGRARTLESDFVGSWSGVQASAVLASFYKQNAPIDRPAHELPKVNDGSDWGDLPLFHLTHPSRSTNAEFERPRFFCEMSLVRWEAWALTQRRTYHSRMKATHRLERRDWGTPAAQNHKDATLTKERAPSKAGLRRLNLLPQQVLHEENYMGGLNTRWVDCLMGLPIGWTSPSCCCVCHTGSQIDKVVR